MHDFYNKIDIFVSTSLSDGGLSSSIAEAMSLKELSSQQIILTIAYGLKIIKMDICLKIKTLLN